jgi:ABC-2 type transport system ATP-binding protein
MVFLMDPAITCRGLLKRFGATVAVDGLDMAVRFGEVHGFLGPNGSGKTVTMRIMLGLLRRDGGEISVLGGDPWRDAVDLHRRMAYVPGDTNLWPNLTGGEILDLLAGLRGGTDVTRTRDLIDRFELDPSKKARTYSKGNRQKVALIAALSSSADLLILDEPTSGLDPLMEAVFAQEIREARAAGRAVLLSSHELAEVEKLCDRVTIINQGRVVEAGTLAELRHLTRTMIRARTQRPIEALPALDGVYDVGMARAKGQKLNAIDDVVHDDVVDDGWELTCEVESFALSQVMSVLAAAGLTALQTQPPTLEDLFLRHYRELQR